jgi:hypothetical protein
VWVCSEADDINEAWLQYNASAHREREHFGSHYGAHTHTPHTRDTHTVCGLTCSARWSASKSGGDASVIFGRGVGCGMRRQSVR